MHELEHRRACACGHRGDGFLLPGADRHYPPDLELSPEHVELRLRVDIGERRLDGSARWTLSARRAGPASIRLHAVAFESVSVRGEGAEELSWKYDGSVIEVTWAEPVAASQELAFTVAWRVTHPTAGLLFSSPCDAYPDAPRFAATDNETERSRHWFPSIDLPNARPRVDMHLTGAKDLTLLANGELVGERKNRDGTRTAHWRLDHPCPSYLTCFAVGEFVRADDGEFDGKPVAYFGVAPSTKEDLLRTFGRTRDMLAFLTDKLGAPLPWPKYFQFAVPGIGGAMENISLVSWDQQFVLDRTLAQEWTWLADQINVHEMAHTWFGDAIVIRDFAHAWLKESWATYMEQCWLEHRYGEDEKLYNFHSDALAYFRETEEAYRRPIVTRQFNSSWDMYDRHLYPGGACRLHTLRGELGDEVFWKGVREYVKRYMGRVVETDDFRRVMEEVSGRSLGRFFDQWFHSKGYPALRVSFAWEEARKEGTFTVEQTQADEKEGIPLFDLSTDLGWVIDGKLETRAIRIDRQKHVFTVAMSREPEQVRFDPRARALHRLEFNPGDGKLRAQLTGAHDVIGRILAAQELARTGRRRNIEAVRDAWAAEKFWGVRVQFARALADAGTDAGIEALEALVGSEKDAMVMEALFRQAGRFRDARILRALSKRVDGDLPYRARQAALEGLGAQRENAPKKKLVKAARTDGFGGIVQSGALRALGLARDLESVPLLMEQATWGARSRQARMAAVSALGDIGRVAEKAIRESIVSRLIDLLRDRDPRVSDAAVGALAGMAASEAVPAVKQYQSALAAQHRLRLERLVGAMRAGTEPRTAALDRQVDELRERIRKLEDALQKLESKVNVTS